MLCEEKLRLNCLLFIYSQLFSLLVFIALNRQAFARGVSHGSLRMPSASVSTSVGWQTDYSGGQGRQRTFAARQTKIQRFQMLSEATNHRKNAGISFMWKHSLPGSNSASQPSDAQPPPPTPPPHPTLGRGGAAQCIGLTAT